MAPEDEEPTVSGDEQKLVEDEEDEEDFEAESDEDDEEEEDDDDYESTVAKKRKKPSKGKRGKAPRSKRHRSGVHGFLDVEAAVGDDDEDDDDEGDEYFNEAEEAHQAEREMDMISHRRRMNQEASFQPRGETRGGAGHLASAIGSLERRFQDQGYHEDVDEVDEEDIGGGLDMMGGYSEFEGHGEDPRRFIPDMADAKLWVVKLAKGTSEREIVISIMNKSLVYNQKGLPFPILSAFAPDGIKGHIYVESESPGKIKECLAGLNRVSLGQPIKMVPMRDMCSVFLMGEKTVQPLARGEWTRIKSGLYSGDIAQVVDHDGQTNVVTVRLVPRIDYSEAIERYKAGGKKRGFTTEKTKLRPIARFFDREEIVSKGGDLEPGPHHGTVKFDGKAFEDTGYLLKKVRHHLLCMKDDVRPTPQEVKDFSSHLADKETLDLTVPIPTARAQSFSNGEAVEIQSGDLSGLRGSILSVDGRSGTVYVKPFNEAVPPISVSLNDIVKYFDIGASVRVFWGPNEGNTGLITSTDMSKRSATVFSPSLLRPFTCLLEELQPCEDFGVGSGGMSRLGGFSAGDLVQLSGHATGVIIRIDPAKKISVLTTEGNVESVSLSGIATKRTSDFSTTLDVNRIPFGPKATVTLGTASHKGQSGRVLHLWKNRVFIKLTAMDDPSAIMVVDGRDVKVTTGDSSFNAFAQNTFQENTPGGDTQHGQQNRGRGGGRGFGRGRGRLTGQRIRIISGEHKGCLATVLSSDDSYVRANLCHKCQVVSVPPTDIVLLDQDRSRNGSFGRGGRVPGGRGRGGNSYDGGSQNLGWDKLFKKPVSKASQVSPDDSSYAVPNSPGWGSSPTSSAPKVDTERWDTSSDWGRPSDSPAKSWDSKPTGDSPSKSWDSKPTGDSWSSSSW